MERRGDGVSIIRAETQEATGLPPGIRSGRRIESGTPHSCCKTGACSCRRDSHGAFQRRAALADIEVLALFPNKTWVRATTDEAGDAALDLYTTNMPMTI